MCIIFKQVIRYIMQRSTAKSHTKIKMEFKNYSNNPKKTGK